MSLQGCCASPLEHSKLDTDRISTKALRLLVVFAAIFAVAAIGISLHRIGGSLTLSFYRTFSPFGRRVWPAVFLAGLAIALWIHQPIAASIGVGIGLASGSSL